MLASTLNFPENNRRFGLEGLIGRKRLDKRDVEAYRQVRVSFFPFLVPLFHVLCSSHRFPSSFRGRRAEAVWR